LLHAIGKKDVLLAEYYVMMALACPMKIYVYHHHAQFIPHINVLMGFASPVCHYVIWLTDVLILCL
jgi:hypothetical protein